ncbi:MAG: DUF4416 family protein [candidate division WOR-3 bacterium]|nr:DUF4416 family protein [candidate division WOR-3 bacterium]MCX7757203.1 DUF4416 family protein [candidate division WOR-3 bacterium]MDW7987929.1 DUF4416 family protein [candidate division WOR-3 bacterium]
MSKIKPAPKGAVIWGLITNNQELCEKFATIIQKDFGAIVLKSNLISFDSYTDYYRKEMGSDLKRQWLMTENLVSLEKMVDTKLLAIQIEKEYVTNEARNINIDPGFLTLANFILLTTKNYSHRIYLRNGIYGEITLIFSQNTYHALPWTYPDYQDNIYFFNKAREVLKTLINKQE